MLKRGSDPLTRPCNDGHSGYAASSVASVMEFRDLGDRRSVQRPSIEADELAPYTRPLKGELAVEDALIENAEGVNLTGEGRISRSRITANSTLAETAYRPLELQDVALDGVDVSNARWGEARLARVELTGCRGIGWQLHVAEAGDVFVEDCRMDMALIDLEKVRGLMVFRNVSLREATFRGRLDQVLLLDCDLSGAEFEVTSARGADLRGSQLAGARGLLGLRGATVDGAQVLELAGQLVSEAGLTVSE